MKLLVSTVAIFALINVIYGVPGKAPLKQLNDGNVIPSLALGTFGFGDIPKVRQAVLWAIQAGYRHIDTAALYGNEEEVGRGIADAIQQGLVKREELFVTTKLWNDKHGRHQVVPALRESLSKLGLSYVDLYLIHSPEATNERGDPIEIDVLNTWNGMEEAKRLGLAKSIGVSNFETTLLERLIAGSKTVPAVNQIEIHPSKTQEKLVADSHERGIEVMAYSPFGFYVSRGSHNNPVRNDRTVADIARKYNKTVNQVLVRYLLDRSLIPIPKSTNQQRIRENIDVFDFQLSAEDINAIGKLDTDTSIFD
ncbi:unnamed protein product [Chrysodeixis includens]|uniref:NADP-dependent oxidoreductase domain-containing protein n=1 Tax=Chrysodeixis includens TaxID=689277 RepID=A0A9P0BX69_CHRIL|nr:unnamed protein product [Chrysodeixis includens]